MIAMLITLHQGKENILSITVRLSHWNVHDYLEICSQIDRHILSGRYGGTTANISIN